MLQVERPAVLDAWKAKVRLAMTILFQLRMDIRNIASSIDTLESSNMGQSVRPMTC